MTPAVHVWASSRLMRRCPTCRCWVQIFTSVGLGDRVAIADRAPFQTRRSREGRLVQVFDGATLHECGRRSPQMPVALVCARCGAPVERRVTVRRPVCAACQRHQRTVKRVGATALQPRACQDCGASIDHRPRQAKRCDGCAEARASAQRGDWSRRARRVPESRGPDLRPDQIEALYRKSLAAVRGRFRVTDRALLGSTLAFCKEG